MAYSSDRDSPILPLLPTISHKLSAICFFLLDFIHVDDFGGFPQIFQLRIRQIFHPIFFCLFPKLNRFYR